MRKTSSRRSVCLYPGKNGRCTITVKKFRSQNVQIFGHVYQNTNGQMEHRENDCETFRHGHARTHFSRLRFLSFFMFLNFVLIFIFCSFFHFFFNFHVFHFFIFFIFPSPGPPWASSGPPNISLFLIQELREHPPRGITKVRRQRHAATPATRASVRAPAHETPK